MWRACIKPLQTWRDFAATCPEPTLVPPRWAGTTGMCCRWWCCSAGRDFQLLPKGNASCCSLCINSDIADTWISKKTSEMYFRSFTRGSFSSCSWCRWDSHLCSLSFFFQEKKSGVLLRRPACCHPLVLLGAESLVRGSTGSPTCTGSRAAWGKDCIDVSQPWSCLGTSSNPWQKYMLLWAESGRREWEITLTLVEL